MTDTLHDSIEDAITQAEFDAAHRSGRDPEDRDMALGVGVPPRPRIEEMQRGVAEFRRGAPADFPTKGASSRLKIAADFVVQVYESDLIRRNLAYRSEIDYQSPQYTPSDASY